jgi:hypothetical protein
MNDAELSRRLSSYPGAWLREYERWKERKWVNWWTSKPKS